MQDIQNNNQKVVMMPAEVARKAFAGGDAKIGKLDVDFSTSNPKHERWTLNNVSDEQLQALLDAGAVIADNDFIKRPDYEIAKTQEIGIMTEQGVEWHGAKEAHAKYDAKGQGTLIHIADTGFADLAPFRDDEGKYRGIFFNDAFTGADEDPLVVYHPHGVHVGGTSGGNNLEGKYDGMAPESMLSATAVLNERGGTLATVMRGIEDALTLAEKYPDTPVIVNMSLGGRASSKEDPLTKLVDEARKKGIIFAVAAGNSGPRKGTVGTPAISKSDMTVAALEIGSTGASNDYNIARFSSRGVADDDRDPNAQKGEPNIGAKGVNVRSIIGEGEYANWNGTSMATPHVAGAFAMLAGFAKREFDAGRMKISWQDMNTQGIFEKLLYETAEKSVTHPQLKNYEIGVGKMNVLKALDLMVERYGKAPGFAADSAVKAAESWALPSEKTEEILRVARSVFGGASANGEYYSEVAIQRAAEFVAQFEFGPNGKTYRGSFLGDDLGKIYEAFEQLQKEIPHYNMDLGAVLEAAIAAGATDDTTIASKIDEVIEHAFALGEANVVAQFARRYPEADDGAIFHNKASASRKRKLFGDIDVEQFVEGRMDRAQRKPSATSAQAVQQVANQYANGLEYSNFVTTDDEGVLGMLNSLGFETKEEIDAIFDALDITHTSDDPSWFGLGERSMYIGRASDGDVTEITIATMTSGRTGNPKLRMVTFPRFPGEARG